MMAERQKFGNIKGGGGDLKTGDFDFDGGDFEHDEGGSRSGSGSGHFDDQIRINLKDGRIDKRGGFGGGSRRGGGGILGGRGGVVPVVRENVVLNGVGGDQDRDFGVGRTGILQTAGDEFSVIGFLIVKIGINIVFPGVEFHLIADTVFKFLVFNLRSTNDILKIANFLGTDSKARGDK
ncbi:MAG: hypothetical protein UT14_C0005G0034 [Candidatus Shapirobacteria bacterium GW2011_GWE1_38_92]|uniref:Uncharacterized protein n=2 Tax=Candidatus Shapironibacteriota TaxID=1752721 RepID=A0A0G0K6E8_9BACT|nr:MAG: hypothetical protein US90_C0004G0012 [Candidatus Shapirobacteria bacterium GW2011_GWE2_38_30]KKQ92337.1 MAG: hypothetical protein UT14_C0005G0034 [Candidatus Shapirobacteria bacterium GW2011_GWE1_38_92]